MRPVSVDLRKRVVTARVNDGQSMGQLARRFKMPKGTVQNILERYRDSGTVVPKPQNSGRKPAFSQTALLKLEKDVLDHPDSTLEELRERSGAEVSLVCIHKTLRKLGFTRKKRVYVRMNNVVRTSPSNVVRGAKG
jgi:transposase